MRLSLQADCMRRPSWQSPDRALNPRGFTHLQVDLLLWTGPRGGQAEVIPMNPGVQGTWSLSVPPGWEGSYYKYR